MLRLTNTVFPFFNTDVLVKRIIKVGNSFLMDAVVVNTRSMIERLVVCSRIKGLLIVVALSIDSCLLFM